MADNGVTTTPLTRRRSAAKTPGSSKSKLSRKSSARKKKKGGAVQQLPDVPAPPDLTGLIVAPFGVGVGHQNWANCFYRWQLELQGRLDEAPIEPELQSKYERWKDKQIRRANHMIHRTSGGELSINRFAKLMEIGVVSEEEAQTLRFDVQQDLEEVMDEEGDLTAEQQAMGLRKMEQRTFTAVIPTKTAAELPQERTMAAVVKTAATGRANAVKKLERKIQNEPTVDDQKSGGSSTSAIPLENSVMARGPGDVTEAGIDENEENRMETISAKEDAGEAFASLVRSGEGGVGRQPASMTEHERESTDVAEVGQGSFASAVAAKANSATEDNNMSLGEEVDEEVAASEGPVERDQRHAVEEEVGHGRGSCEEDAEQEREEEETKVKQYISNAVVAEGFPTRNETLVPIGQLKDEQGALGGNASLNQKPSFDGPVCRGGKRKREQETDQGNEEENEKKEASSACMEDNDKSKALSTVPDGKAKPRTANQDEQGAPIGNANLSQKPSFDEAVCRGVKRKLEQETDQGNEEESEKKKAPSACMEDKDENKAVSTVSDGEAKPRTAKRPRLLYGPPPRTWFQYGIDVFKHAFTF